MCHQASQPLWPVTPGNWVTENLILLDYYLDYIILEISPLKGSQWHSVKFILTIPRINVSHAASDKVPWRCVELASYGTRLTTCHVYFVLFSTMYSTFASQESDIWQKMMNKKCHNFSCTDLFFFWLNTYMITNAPHLINHLK